MSRATTHRWTSADPSGSRSRTRELASARRRGRRLSLRRSRRARAASTGGARAGSIGCSTARRLRLDDACDRWRGLYRSALATSSDADCRDHGRESRAGSQAEAKRLRREAEAQLELLTADERPELPVGLLQLPVHGQRGLPAGLQLPAAATVGLHPRPRAPGVMTATSSCSALGSWRSPSSGRAA